MLGRVRNNPGQGGGNAIGGKGLGGGGIQQLKLSSLEPEEQRVWELLENLRQMNEKEMRKRVLEVAEVKEPLTPKGLKKIAELYASLEMPFTVRGIQMFKALRGLTGGTAIAGEVARAYVRALDGEEILIKVNRVEEARMRPSEKAVLRFLRRIALEYTADEIAPVKRALRLNNPPMDEMAELLENEYIGVTTVQEIAHATTMRSIPVSRTGMRQLVHALREEKAARGDEDESEDEE